MNSLPAAAIQRVSEYLPNNDIATSFRFTTKYIWTVLSGPRYSSVVLAEPVNTTAFSARWGSDADVSQISVGDRRSLVRQTAASGVLANLQLLLRLPSFRNLSADETEEADKTGGADEAEEADSYHLANVMFAQAALKGAVAAGRHEVCRWLTQSTRAMVDFDMAVAAARAGHLEVLGWAMGMRRLCPDAVWTSGAGCQLTRVACAAAEAGHDHVVRWLVGRGPGTTLAALVGAAWGGHVQLVREVLGMPWVTSQPGRGGAAAADDGDTAGGASLASQLTSRDWLELAWCLLDTAPMGSDVSPILELLASKEACVAMGIGSGDDGGSSSSGSAATPAISDAWWLAILSALARPAQAGDDWRARAEWLYGKWKAVAGGRGRMYRASYDACVRMIRGSHNAEARLGWLRNHGVGPEEVESASGSSSGSSSITNRVAIVQGRPPIWRHFQTYALPETIWRGISYVPPMGNTQWLQPIHDGNLLLYVRGYLVDQQPLHRSEQLFAAERGQLRAVQCLVESGCCGETSSNLFDHGAAPALIPELFAAAALSGSEPLLQWLASSGCPMDGAAWVTAATYGGAAQLQLLQRLGCPMPVG